MRSELGNARDTTTPGCSFTDGVSTQAVAAVYYQDADTNSLPTTSPSWTEAQLEHCGNDDLSKTTPLCPKTLDANPKVQNVDITFGNNGTNFVWFMNGESFRADYNIDLLSHVKDGNLTFEPEWNVFDMGEATAVRLTVTNSIPVSHPMHLHGHNFHVLNEGVGAWDGSIINEGNTQMRDVQLMQPAVPPATANGTVTESYIVLQWTQDNPAVWPFHCHIAWHVSGGLYINILERPTEIQSSRNIPSSVADTCQAWADWTATNIPDQIDSGL
jgi:FtsP/CotA-like multicopper oxidase with cupredoxin domain